MDSDVVDPDPRRCLRLRPAEHGRLALALIEPIPFSSRFTFLRYDRGPGKALASLRNDGSGYGLELTSVPERTPRTGCALTSAVPKVPVDVARPDVPDRRPRPRVDDDSSCKSFTRWSQRDGCSTDRLVDGLLPAAGRRTSFDRRLRTEVEPYDCSNETDHGAEN